MSPADFHRVQLTGGPAGFQCSLKIDGHEILSATEVTLTAKADEVNVATISLACADFDVDGQYRVWFDGGTLRALEALGWSPPESRSAPVPDVNE